MLKWFIIATAWVLVPPAIAQQMIPMQLNQLVQWEPTEDGAVFDFEGLHMQLELIYPDDSNDYVEGADLHVSGLGYPLTLHTDAGLSGFGELGVYAIDTSENPSIIFGAYTGGAHCCMAVQSVLLTDVGPTVADVGYFDGDLVEPADIDGDGRFEFSVSDGRFNYTFDSYAGSFSPVLIYDTDNGVLRDVTSAPKYYGAIKTDMHNQAQYCGGESWSASACAALAANAARIGKYDQVRDMIAQHLQTGSFDSGWDEFSFCQEDGCEDTKDFTDFLEALDFALEKWGYL